MKFMNCSPEKLLKNLPDNGFKYLTKEFHSKNLELFKQKDAYPYEYKDIFKRFDEQKLPDEKCFYSSLKDGATDDSGEKLDGHISDEDYLMCNKFWNEFSIKNMSDYHVLKVDSYHYFSFPGLKITGVKLEKTFDIKM